MVIELFLGGEASKPFQILKTAPVCFKLQKACDFSKQVFITL